MKSFGLLAIHLVGAFVTMLVVLGAFGERSLQSSLPGGELVGLLVSFLPEVSRQVLVRSSGASTIHRNASFVVHTVVLGATCGMLSGGLAGSLTMYSLVIMWELAGSASILLQDNTTDPVYSGICCVCITLFSFWLSVYVASYLGLPIDWNTAILAGISSAVLTAGFVWQLRRVLSRTNPDDFWLVVVTGSQCAIMALILQELARSLQAAMVHKVHYYVMILISSGVALTLVWLWQGSVEEVFTEEALASPPSIEVHIRGRLPFGFVLSSTLYGLPRVADISPACAHCQIRVGDVLVGVNGMPVTFRTWKTMLQNRVGYCELNFRRHESTDTISETVVPQATQMPGGRADVVRVAAAGGA